MLDMAVLKYPGAKWQIAPSIVEHLPPHAHYIEPYAGSLAVFFSKAPSRHEVVNDLDDRLINFLRVCRQQPEDLASLLSLTPWSRTEYYLSYERSDDPLEDARRMAVRLWQAHGVKTYCRTGWRHNGVKGLYQITGRWARLPEVLLQAAARLKEAEIESRPALELISRYNAPDALLYVDPPYPLDSRAQRKMYLHEMGEQDHVDLLDALDKHTGPVVLSSYDNPLYTERLAHWQSVRQPGKSESGDKRTEVLWLNEHAARPRLF